MAKRRVLGTGFILWAGFSVLLVAGCIGVLVWSISQRPQHNLYAEQAGQKLVISLVTGEVVSSAVTLPEALEEKPLPAETKPEQPKPAPPAAHTPVSPADIPKSVTIPMVTPPSALKQKAYVAVLLMELGLSNSTTENSLQLPREVAFGFSPYAPELQESAQKAALAGHEVLVNIPMEPTNYPIDVPGPYALLTELSDYENLKRLQWVLGRFEGYVGAYSRPGEKFSYTIRNIRLVLEKLKEKHVFFVYGGGAENSALQQVSKELQLPFVAASEIIDTDISSSAIEEKLAHVESIARKNGYAVALGSPYPVTVKLLAQWTASLEAKGLQLVPLNTLLQKLQHKS